LAPTLLSAGSAHATQGTCLLISLTNNSSACDQTLGGVVFSNFSFSGFTASSADVFQLDGVDSGDGAVTLDFNGSRTASISGQFSYTVTLLPDPATRAFDFIEANIAGLRARGSSGSTSVSSSGLPNPATDTLVAAGTSQTFNPILTTQTFTQTFSYTHVGGTDRLDNVGNQFFAYVATPSPIPLLGAATAFG
jgi:hypothetical protein